MHTRGALVVFSLRAIEWYRRTAPASVRSVCLFEPTCSAYAVEAVTRYGFVKGWALALRRIRRCRPPHGGADPVP